MTSVARWSAGLTVAAALAVSGCDGAGDCKDAACDTTPPPPDATDAVTDADADADADSDADADADADADSDADTDTTDTGQAPDPCFTPSATLTIDAVSVANGRLGNDRELDVTLSEPASVAALCTSDDDPTEQHFVESTDVATEHALRFQGLVGDADYTCAIAPTCPTMAGPPVEQALTTGRVDGFPDLSVTVDPALGMTGYWTLLQYIDGACSFGARGNIVLYDGEGHARWSWELPSGLWIDLESLYDPADGTIVWGGGEGDEGRARIVDLWDGETYVTVLPNWQDTEFHHDAKRLADGRILTLEKRDNQVGSSTWTGFGVRLHDPATQTVDFELNSQRYVDEGWLRTAGGFFDQDPYHANWLQWYEDPVGGDRLYMSLCFDWSLMSFDAATGDVRWKVAEDEGWTVLDAAGNEIGDGELPQCQHGAEVLGDDHLLLYDNGQGRSFTRVLEITVDPAARTVTKNFEWTEPDWHEGTLGDVDELPGDRLLVTEAHPECWSETRGDRSAIVEVDRATGQVASRLVFPGAQDTTYRAQRIEGCDLAEMSSVKACPARADRAAELGPYVGW